MPKYAVFIDASNFQIEVDDETARHGFFATCFVEASDPKSAELAAVQSLRDDPELRSIVQNAQEDPPVMDVEEIREVEAFPDAQPGRVWYRMETKRWWQFWKR